MKNTFLYAVIGDPVAHSLSPAMHNAAFQATGKDAEYIAVRVAPENIDSFFEEARGKLCGFNVTVPHKVSAHRLCDVRSEGAQLSGSVNTVKIHNGQMYGDTTDGTGFERAVREAFDLPLKDLDLCFIGCGGVVQALVWHCALAGVRSIRILNRSLDKAEALKEQISTRFPAIPCSCAAINDREKTAEFLSASKLAVQCTSLGLHGDDPMPVDPDLFPREGIFYFDTIYKHTPLLTALEKMGVPTQHGLAMLLHQGAKSYEIWFDEEAPVEVMRKALVEAMAERGN